MPPCHAYLHVLADFVKDFAGGPNAPVLKYLDSFSKEFGGTKKLGEVFMSVVTSLKFGTQASKFPFTRAACIACNLASPVNKVQDGHARLLVKSDILSLARKDKLLKLTAAENMMSEAWFQLQGASTESKLSNSDCNVVFGRLSTRVVLLLVNKEKDGIEGAKYSALSAIQAKFDEEFKERLVGTTAAPASSITASDPSTESANTAKLEEVSDPVWIATDAGYTVGSHYTCKSLGAQIWELTAFVGTGATFTEYNLHAKGAPAETHVKFDGLKNMHSFKGKLQEHLSDIAQDFMPENHATLQKDARRASILTQLMKAVTKHGPAATKSVSFFVNPSELRAKHDIPKGQLKLIPATDLARIVSKSMTSQVTPLAPNAKHQHLI